MMLNWTPMSNTVSPPTSPIRALLGQRKTWLLLFVLVLVGVPTIGLECVIVYFAAKGRMTIEAAALLSLGTVAVGAFSAVALGWKHMSAMLFEDNVKHETAAAVEIARIDASSPKVPQNQQITAVNAPASSETHETPAETPQAKRE